MTTSTWAEASDTRVTTMASVGASDALRLAAEEVLHLLREAIVPATFGH